ARGYNIDSLTVSETQDKTISRMTVVVNAEDEKILEQIKKQLNKLIDVITVVDYTKKEYIERELVFIKIAADKKLLPVIKKLTAKAGKAGARLLEKKSDFIIVELVDDQEHIRNFLAELEDFKVVEVVRSGRIAIAK
ncbi:MAG: acetolactate synthase small subunit, partial [Candidatus Omnitrophota bacterium]